MSKSKLSGCLICGLFALMTPAGVHAQTVEECRAEIRKVQAFIDEQEDQSVYEDASQKLEQAEFAAGKGEGKKCMEFAKEAKGSAGSLGPN